MQDINGKTRQGRQNGQGQASSAGAAGRPVIDYDHFRHQALAERRRELARLGARLSGWLRGAPAQLEIAGPLPEGGR